MVWLPKRVKKVMFSPNTKTASRPSAELDRQLQRRRHLEAIVVGEDEGRQPAQREHPDDAPVRHPEVPGDGPGEGQVEGPATEHRGRLEVDVAAAGRRDEPEAAAPASIAAGVSTMVAAPASRKGPKAGIRLEARW